MLLVVVMAMASCGGGNARTDSAPGNRADEQPVIVEPESAETDNGELCAAELIEKYIEIYEAAIYEIQATTTSTEYVEALNTFTLEQELFMQQYGEAFEAALEDPEVEELLMEYADKTLKLTQVIQAKNNEF